MTVHCVHRARAEAHSWKFEGASGCYFKKLVTREIASNQSTVPDGPSIATNTRLYREMEYNGEADVKLLLFEYCSRNYISVAGMWAKSFDSR